jgi:hypothetical protein
MNDDFDWADVPLGEDWWWEAAANCHATEQQIIFAACRHLGMTATGAARKAKYAGDDATLRQAGHRAAHSTAVMGLLSMAKAETGQGPNVRIKAIEGLAKIERDEREFEAQQQESRTSLHDEIREIGKISPELAEAYAKQKGVAWNGGTNE